MYISEEYLKKSIEIELAQATIEFRNIFENRPSLQLL